MTDEQNHGTDDAKASRSTHPSTRVSPTSRQTRDQISGSLYGLLVGDALGCPVEGMDAAAIEEEFGVIDQMVDGHRRWRPAGLHSDDGQQAIALLDAVLADPIRPVHSFASALVALRNAGPSGFRKFGLHRGTGGNFRNTVMGLRKRGDLNAHGVEETTLFEDATVTAGNGAAMRVAPLACFFRGDDDAMLDAVIRTANVTHADARGVAAAAAVAFVVARAFEAPPTANRPLASIDRDALVAFVRRTEDVLQDRLASHDHFRGMSAALEAVLPHAAEPIPALCERIENAVTSQSDRPVGAGAGFAPASVTLSLCVALEARSFEQALVDVISAGDDTDTTAAMVGQMVGAGCGRGAIPLHWMNALWARGVLEDRIDAVVQRRVPFVPGFSLVELETPWTEALNRGPTAATRATTSTRASDSADNKASTRASESVDDTAEPTEGAQASLLADVEPTVTAVERKREGLETAFSSAPAPALNDETPPVVPAPKVAADAEAPEPPSASNDDEDADDDASNDDEPFWMTIEKERADDAERAAPAAPDAAAPTPTTPAPADPATPASSAPPKPPRDEDEHQLSIFDVAPARTIGRTVAPPRVDAVSPESETAPLVPTEHPFTPPAAPPAAPPASPPASPPATSKNSGPLFSPPKEEPVEAAPESVTLPSGTTLSLVKGDITKVKVDAIVNAANTSLLGGGGVDGAIHRAGGPAILEDCRAVRARQGGCKTGEAVITGAGRLPALRVIHTVGPRWRGGEHREEELLANAYRNALTLARENNLKSVAFPSISTGIYKFPIERASRIALKEIAAMADAHPGAFDEVQVVLFEAPDLWIYQQAKRELFAT